MTHQSIALSHSVFASDTRYATKKTYTYVMTQITEHFTLGTLK